MTTNVYRHETKVILARLARKAYETELANELAQLKQKFTEWEEERITVWELDHYIRAYCQEPSRELSNKYSNVPLELVMAYAIVDGIIDEEVVPEEVMPFLANAISLYKANLCEGEAVQVGVMR